MHYSYIAGVFDGDGSICIGKCRGGFQLKAELTQCNETFLRGVHKVLSQEAVRIYRDNREDKYNHEAAHSLRYCGIIANPLLNIIQDYAIIKAPQATLAIEYNSLANQVGLYDVRETYYSRMKQLNADKMAYKKDYSKINNEYIAGLLDAEGNIYINTVKRSKSYVKITQKSEPEVLTNIQSFLGFGKISPSEPYRLRFYSKDDIANLWILVKDHLIIKRDKYEQLVSLI